MNDTQKNVLKDLSVAFALISLSIYVAAVVCSTTRTEQLNDERQAIKKEIEEVFTSSGWENLGETRLLESDNLRQAVIVSQMLTDLVAYRENLKTLYDFELGLRQQSENKTPSAKSGLKTKSGKSATVPIVADGTDLGFNYCEILSTALKSDLLRQKITSASSSEKSIATSEDMAVFASVWKDKSFQNSLEQSYGEDALCRGEINKLLSQNSEILLGYSPQQGDDSITYVPNAKLYVESNVSELIRRYPDVEVDIDKVQFRQPTWSQVSGLMEQAGSFYLSQYSQHDNIESVEVPSLSTFQHFISGWDNLATERYWSIFMSSFLLLISIVATILFVIYLIMHKEISQRSKRLINPLLLIFSLPTFVAAMLFRDFFAFDPSENIVLALLGVWFVGTIASGISFELAQVFSDNVRFESQKSYVVLLRSWGFLPQKERKSIPFISRITSVIIYFVHSIVQIVTQKDSFATTSKEIEPFLLRAAEHNNIEYLRRRVSYIVDALIIVCVFFNLKSSSPAVYFIEMLKNVTKGNVVQVSAEIISGFACVVMLSATFRIIGTLVKGRLFEWKS